MFIATTDVGIQGISSAQHPNRFIHIASDATMMLKLEYGSETSRESVNCGFSGVVFVMDSGYM